MLKLRKFVSDAFNRLFQNNLNADLTDIENAINAQDNRINNIVANAGNSNSEVVDARQEPDGTKHEVLREHLFSIHNKIRVLQKNAVSIYEYEHLKNGIDWYPAIQQAIEDTKGTKKAVIIPYGIFDISQNLTIYRYTKIYGIGKDLSTIRLMDGKNCDVIKTYMFDTYKGTTITGSTEDTANLNVPIAFEIRDLSIDGNFGNNTSGYGLRIYGKHYILDNIIVKRCAEVGVYTEYGDNYIYKAEDTPETYINLEVHESGGENFIFNGPADISITRLYCGWAGKKYANSKVFPGEKVHNVVFQKGAEIGETHAFENEYGYAYRFMGISRIHADLIIGESAHGCVRVDQGVSFNVSKLRAHRNRSNANPAVLLDSDIGISIAGVDIRKFPTDGTAPMLHIKKENAKVRGIISGNASGGCYGDGVWLEAGHCDLDLNIRHLKSTVAAGTAGATYGIITNKTTTYKRNILKLQIQGCDNAWHNANVGVGSLYNITIKTDKGQSYHYGQGKNGNREIWNVLVDDTVKGYLTTDYVVKYNNCLNISTAGEQTVTLAHYYPFIPAIEQVTLQLIDSGTVNDYAFAYIRVYSVDAKNVVIKFKMATPSARARQWVSLRLGVR